MKKVQAYYSILQFCPEPARLEYVNVGIFLFCQDKQYVGVKFSETPRRVEKLYGPQNHAFFNTLKDAFSERVRVEFSQFQERSLIERFASMRANQLRMSKLLPMSVLDPDKDLSELFYELVGVEKPNSRRSSVRSKLKNIFKDAGVLDFLDEPEPVSLPEFGIDVSVPFGYQNGSYNLIDPVRLDHDAPADALKEAGKRAIEGKWLEAHFSNEQAKKRLVVVGDFDKQPDNFYRAVLDLMSEHKVSLHRLDALDSLLTDIKQHMPHH
ncbi:DUF3037 domain-containing protein [Magnetovibrio blakemorei]|uniref:DUF3037 domain-containing protein n=1 Tax=Magnetovibrio blakemorei TaxID=28181 RepID=A0A1E5Q3W7_9PROT|nr:DUF3037 domain-containing protein [Magnetovibrio blakemorei]OEJ64558.1 hypothetical protein BEN30_16145 [Magnetovibrio blakemorei]